MNALEKQESINTEPGKKAAQFLQDYCHLKLNELQ